MKQDNEQLEKRRTEIVEQLSTETLPITEFETLCREQNEIMILQASRKPRHYSALEGAGVGRSFSLPNNTMLPR